MVARLHEAALRGGGALLGEGDDLDGVVQFVGEFKGEPTGRGHEAGDQRAEARPGGAVGTQDRPVVAGLERPVRLREESTRASGQVDPEGHQADFPRAAVMRSDRSLSCRTERTGSMSPSTMRSSE